MFIVSFDEFGGLVFFLFFYLNAGIGVHSQRTK